MKNKYLLLILLLINIPALASGDKCSHSLDISCAYNPKPAFGDLILPMPKLNRVGVLASDGKLDCPKENAISLLLQRELIEQVGVINIS